MALWSCPTCSKSFARKGDLTRHKLIHSGIKPHVCEFCGKGFSQFSGLKTHLNVHTRAKPYVCGIGTCSKAFGDPSSRTRHRKETHSREGAYKCVVSDCGTRIKRRSAFVAHLRKHGLDPNAIDLDAIVQKSSKNRIVAPVHVTSLEVENKSDQKIESPNMSPPPLVDSSGYYVLSKSDVEARFANIGESSDAGDDSFDYGRTNWSLANNTLHLSSVPDQVVDVGPPCHPNNIYSYISGNFENPLYLDGILNPPVDYPLLLAPSDLGTLQLFSETGSDGSQSLWSSPSSTYSSLYTSSLNNDVLSSSPIGNVS